MFKRILVPTDGSDITAKAIDTSIGLARALVIPTVLALFVAVAARAVHPRTPGRASMVDS